ncbi:MAG TPA: M20/M25/M40 family metallo-hydrolase, partial [Planctomycetota bacterium]|nr:M20/M25/M40 family metallo-hydrolase [Planctomycetota bacterium]
MFHAAARLAVYLLCAIGAAILLFAEPLVTLFVPGNSEVIRLGALYIAISALSEPFFAMSFVLGGALRGAGDTKSPVFVAFVGKWMMMSVDWLVRMVLLWAIYRRGRWKLLKLKFMRRFVPVLSALLLTCTGAPARKEAPGPPPPRTTTLGSPEAAIADWLEDKRDAMVDMVERVVNQNSGSHNLDGLAKVREFFAKELGALGFECGVEAGGSLEIPRRPGRGEKLRFGDHLVARRAGERGQKVLLMGHLDTVFGPEHPFRRFDRATGKGPGALDMKGGIVILVWALRAIAAKGHLDGARLTVILNADEE